MNFIQQFALAHSGHNVVIESLEQVTTEYSYSLDEHGYVFLGDQISQDIRDTDKDQLLCKTCLIGIDITGELN